MTVKTIEVDFDPMQRNDVDLLDAARAAGLECDETGRPLGDVTVDFAREDKVIFKQYIED